MTRTGRRGLAGRAGWGFLDQALSSAANFLLGVVIARSVGAESFGAFGLAFSLYLITLNLARAAATEPLLIRYVDTGTEERRRATAWATGTAAAVGLAGSAVALVVAILAPEPLREAFLPLALVLPFLVVQDAWRFSFVAAGRPRDTFLNDAVWAGTLVTVLGVLLVSDRMSVATAILAWGLAGMAGTAAGARRAGTRPRPTRARSWIVEHRDLAPRFMLEALTGLVANQGILIGVGFIVGLEGAGALRAGQLLMGPMQVVFMAVTLIAIPEGVRLLARGTGTLVRATAVLALGMAAAVLAWTLLLLNLPDEIGAALVGESWAGAQDTIPGLGLALAGLVAASGAGIGLRVLADARRSLRARATDAAAGLSCGLAGAVAGGAAGAAWGAGLGALVGATAYWLMFRRSLIARSMATGADRDRRGAEVRAAPVGGADGPVGPVESGRAGPDG